MIEITDEGLQLIANELAKTFRDQIVAGIDEDGNPFPVGVDLVGTGALLASITGVVIDGVPQISVGVPYAPFVLSRYKSTKLCPQYQEILIARCQPIVAQHSRLVTERAA
jgi:hypothetical protein